ncbi:hypothetical protein P175DRAFT_0497818 [Aspergillus ochraceoroseus IBT 24754]|uniref:Uncharacterized protein n=1 Tax=Aspergillus ochraceoroseus IBT 24754 TaxID=1392256 RepID=A0A2T5M826_9EURO|nr:uncharacterized protein P175DRAFT_0497818 [Aspergillus ochraceoroseus IBT 24754]PTU24701.1 hypothetical protein P175DRAFT_0497818 [Aspergillus ochraceoroseus IBT 24754]
MANEVNKNFTSFTKAHQRAICQPPEILQLRREKRELGAEMWSMAGIIKNTLGSLITINWLIQMLCSSSNLIENRSMSQFTFYARQHMQDPTIHDEVLSVYTAEYLGAPNHEAISIETNPTAPRMSEGGLEIYSRV